MLVLANGDQALAAEPGFHGDTPSRGVSVGIAIGHGSDHLPEVTEQQPENDLAVGPGPAAVLRRVVEDGAGGAAVEAPARAMIEFVGREFGGQRQWGGGALRQGGLEVADTFFHGAVVAREVGRVVQG